MSDKSINLETLPRHYDSGRQLHPEPAIWLFPDFASAKEINALRDAGRDQLQPAQVSGSAGGVLSAGRSGSNCWVPYDQNPVIRRVAKRISLLVGIPLENAESFQLVYYGPGEEYRPHYDAWDANTERGARCMARGGQRLVTTLLYLNNVAGGGGTGFPNLRIDVDATPGSLLLFHNCPAGTALRHDDTLHAGLPVTEGEKWAANLWFRQRDYRLKT